MLIFDKARIFSITLKVIPTRMWSPEALTRADLTSLPSVHGHLDVNLQINPALKGTFKTAHPGSITLNPGGVLLPSLSGKVCVKQLYFSGESGAVRRYGPSEERNFIYSEVGCLDWARILLDLTYQFMEAYEGGQENFPGTIPKLRFVEAAIAECDIGKFFLVEE